MNSSPSQLDRYQTHLQATASWLLNTVGHGRGGSSAHWSWYRGWSPPYPETTGYLVPTMLSLEARLGGGRYHRAAISLGEWLLSIQRREGAWNGGMHPPKKGGRASAFNTGQILKGMAALYRTTGEQRWLDAAMAGAAWLVRGLGPDGLWTRRDYQSDQTPSYYAHVAWPMLEVWRCSGDDELRVAARRILDAVMERRRPNGAFSLWSFHPRKPAYTHTIAYTLRGFLEGARLLDAWESYGEPLLTALDVLLRKTELAGGRLPGSFDQDWAARENAVCLTGNAQIACCLLRWEEHRPDLRLVNGAAKLVDAVCAAQPMSALYPSALRGAVAGSSPAWGSYMILRYPNWAAKYHVDALLLLERRLRALEASGR